MSGATVPADISGHMLDLDEDEDLEVFSKNTSLADGNPMPNSPDSMVNQFRLDEENEEEQQGAINKDIFVTVDNPESHISAIETFITYRVVTRVSC
ncbi:PREDICTED: sorting nexin-7-like [Poecilia mexicana]|uniref:sorting nexin-7-like n=1 Tax=Poecilia mexicana TaxID=48701 RepID=UPI00072E4F86|nr:PREDICTED: sorting nexin-7-like [Poecilia mexicana]